MSTSNWHFDEMKQIGVDFADPAVVAKYDARQQSDLAGDRKDANDWGIDQGSLLIEYGPGTGTFVLAAAERGARVIAVDVSPAMLDYARRQVARAKLDQQVEFHHAGFLTYQHQGKPADFIVTQFAFHHLPDFWKTVALDRIFAQLKPGGKFILRDVIFSFPANEYVTNIDAWIDNLCSGTGDGWARSDLEMHVRDEHSTFAWILDGMLQRAGFRIDRVEFASPTNGLYVCSKPNGDSGALNTERNDR